MKHYIPGMAMRQDVRIRQDKFVTKAARFTSNGRAVSKPLVTDFEATYKQFLSVSR